MRGSRLRAAGLASVRDRFYIPKKMDGHENSVGGYPVLAAHGFWLNS
jgi:hypothetical protein